MAETYSELYRPQFHFSAARGWVGDPNGLFCYQGNYHLFWWGHAVSKDLVHWNELPHPMKGDDGSFHYFSGSVIVDQANTSDLGSAEKPPMLAIYTANRGKHEDQRYSVSKDHRFFWYEGVVIPERTPTERDPDVFWHEPSKKWIMTTCVPEAHQIRIYGSKNLLDWTFLSDFGPLGAKSENWEIPNLFSLPGGAGEPEKWVMLCGMGPNKTQYFTGNFDGIKFTPDADTMKFLAQNSDNLHGREPARWLDWGSDFYAARAFRNIDKGGEVEAIIAWMGNWKYANDTPTTWGRGALSIPRKIKLVKTASGAQLQQTPYPKLRELRSSVFDFSKQKLGERFSLPESVQNQNIYELEAKFTYKTGGREGNFGLEMCLGDSQYLRLTYDPKREILSLDRSASGRVDFNNEFPDTSVLPISMVDGELHLRVFVDASSIEVFVNGGMQTITSLVFPDPKQYELRWFSDSKSCKLKELKMWPLRSIWNKKM